jgi:hypothetical protein
VKSSLHTWFQTGRQQFHEAFFFDFLAKSFLHTWFRTGRQRNQKGSSLINVCSPYNMVHLQLVEKEIKRPSSLIFL